MAVETGTCPVVLISSRGLRLAMVPSDLPQTFRVFEPIPSVNPLFPPTQTLRLYLRKDPMSYVEEET